MQAAGELLLERGYESFSLREVAKRTGFSPGNIYLYFDNKDDLLYSAIEDGFRHFGARLEAVKRETPDPRARIEALGRAYVAFGLESPVHYTLMFVQRTDYLFVERPVPGVETLGYLAEAVAEAMATGAIREEDVGSMTDTLWALVHGVVSLALAMPFIDEARAQRMVEQAFAFMKRSLRTD